MNNREKRIGNFHSHQTMAIYQQEPKVTALERIQRDRKLCDSLETAITRSGLQDGMTVSFHHAFRAGDYIVNMVMNKIAEMGFKNLTLASSSLTDIHSPLIEHIKNGVIRKIYTSGLRGELADQISNGLMEEPVVIHSHGMSSPYSKW